MRTLNFAGGERMKTKLQEILHKVRGGQIVKVGFLEGAKYPDGTPVPMVAALNEFGTSKMPARPFFRDMIAEKSPNWGKSLAALTKAADYDMQQAMASMGEGIGMQLQRSIGNFSSVPLADSTIAKKGFDKQLIDSGHMQNSVGYQVNNGEKVTLPPATSSGGKSK